MFQLLDIFNLMDLPLLWIEDINWIMTQMPALLQFVRHVSIQEKHTTCHDKIRPPNLILIFDFASLQPPICVGEREEA